MDLTHLTLVEAANAIRKGEISPVELTEAHLARIGRIDADLKSFITITPDIALNQAHNAEAAIQRGGYSGLLHGIPLALKDVYETKDVRTTAGSKIFAGYYPNNDSAVVEKVRTAGAIILGKLNMHEWALGVSNDNPHFGTCKNPWDYDRIPGGSSGGSAAALAAELCLGSLGSDTGGSIRIPAALCGVVGLKPTRGRVSLRGVVPVSWNLDHAGPMARSVYDVAALLQTIAGYDFNDPSSVNTPVEDYLAEIGDGVKAWRIAIADKGHFANADENVLEAVYAAARQFESMGAQLTGVDIRIPVASDMISTDAAAFHRERLRSQSQDFGADVLARLQAAASGSATDYALARRTQALVKRKFETFFDDYDLLLTPTTPSTAPMRSQLEPAEASRQYLSRFTAPFNLAGIPALSLPCGFDKSGLPIGLQIAARHWDEAAVVRAGYAFERATDWHSLRPSL